MEDELFQNTESKGQISKTQISCFSQSREKLQYPVLQLLWCFHCLKKIRQKANIYFVSLD